jgi:hypothetical protein
MGTKTLKSSPDSKAGVTVAGSSTRINSNEDTSLMVDDKGITLNGPISFVSGSSQMRFGGLWTMNTEMALMLPSTMATPTPVMMINPPIKQIAGLVADSVAMMGMFGVTSL